MKDFKKEFERWLFDNPQQVNVWGYQFDAFDSELFGELPESMKWGVYQDFFDSVGMHIFSGIYGYRIEAKKYDIIINKKISGRKEANEAARLKAIEIFESNE